MSWATTAETLTYTGIEVTDAEIAQAQAIVELFADVTEDATLSTKNSRLLKMAVAYQAAWITEHPDLFTHVDVSTMLQDGLQFVSGHENAFVLAPFARRAINRLSWRRNRSIKVRRPKRSTMRGLRQIDYLGTSYNLNGAAIDRKGSAFDSSDDGGLWEDE
jgi:hypothetical protein